MQTKPQLVYDDALVAEIAAEIATVADADEWTDQLAGIYENPDPTVCYQSRDWKIVDYRSTRIANLDYAVRGPVPEVLTPGGYFVTLGSSVTFGAGVERPYATILSERLGLPVLNLAFAGASPEFYVRHHASGLRHWLEGAAFVIVETMSSRSISNSRFESVEGRRDATEVKHPDTPAANVTPVLRRMLKSGKNAVLSKVMRESLEAHEALFGEIVAMTEAPVIGLWLSKRSPDAVDREKMRRNRGMMARALKMHPHFADRALVDRLAAKSAAFVEVTSQRGQPSFAVNRFTKKPDTWWNGNKKQSHYPSPEMHEDAAEALLPVAREQLGVLP
jgi:hypothetical protein